MRLLVTPREACLRLNTLEGLLPSDIELVPTGERVTAVDRIHDLLRSVDGAVLDVEMIDEAVLDGTKNLRVISRFGVGYDSISINALRARGISLCNTPGVMADAVARQTVALALAVAFNIPWHDRALKAGRWERKPNLSVARTTLGIAGLGVIGLATARLASSLGFRVVAYSRTARPEGLQVVQAFDELLRQCEIVSLHLPLTADTRGIIGRDRLAQMKGKYLINTGRGGLVDEAAVLNALEKGSLEGYATDVFGSEPVEGLSAQLAAHPKVIGCPHVAAYDDETAEAMVRRSVLNAVHCLQGRHDLVNAYVHQAQGD